MCQFNLWVDIGNSSVDWEIGSCYDSVDIKDFQPSVIPQHHTSTIACVANQTTAAEPTESKLPTTPAVSVTNNH
jgi:hypothetical protein